jgi:UDP-glucose 4-epimerase
VLLSVLGRINQITVFGTDYPTRDGTCIRDYIHVLDLAAAHASALNYLRSGGRSAAFNLGTGKGCSVKEIIDLCEQVTGRKVPVEFGPRRNGDPPELVADAVLAREKLGWETQHTPVDMIESAWRWFSADHSGRYASRAERRRDSYGFPGDHDESGSVV